MNGGKWPRKGERSEPPKTNKGDIPENGPSIKWKIPLWQILMMLLMLWIWQDAITNYTVKTLTYSEFKTHLKNGR